MNGTPSVGSSLLKRHLLAEILSKEEQKAKSRIRRALRQNPETNLLNLKTVKFTIRGTSPYVHHKWGHWCGVILPKQQKREKNQ